MGNRAVSSIVDLCYNDITKVLRLFHTIRAVSPRVKRLILDIRMSRILTKVSFPEVREDENSLNKDG